MISPLSKSQTVESQSKASVWTSDGNVRDYKIWKGTHYLVWKGFFLRERASTAKSYNSQPLQQWTEPKEDIGLLTAATMVKPSLYRNERPFHSFFGLGTDDKHRRDDTASISYIYGPCFVCAELLQKPASIIVEEASMIGGKAFRNGWCCSERSSMSLNEQFGTKVLPNGYAVLCGLSKAAFRRSIS